MRAYTGSEIRTALVESRKIKNCVCQLGDRPFQITFKRAIGSLTFYQKIKLTFSILFSNPSMTKEEVEKYKQNDILETYLNQLGDEYPAMKRALVDERDMYLAYSIASCTIPLAAKNENAIFTQRLKESRNSLASVEQQLNNCKHELDNFKKIKSSKSPKNQSPTDENHDSQIVKYELQLDSLKNQYYEIHQQVIHDTQKLATVSEQFNNYDSKKNVVVGIVGMGHVPGILKHFGKVNESDVKAILDIPQPSLHSQVVRKVIKYSFYSFLAYGFVKYVLPKNVKESIFYLSIKSVNYSKGFINDKVLVKRL